ncbi:MAG: TolC family protein [Thermoanaerobaculia bacterium]
MHSRTLCILAAAALLSAPLIGQQTDFDNRDSPPDESMTAARSTAPADRILEAQMDSQLRVLIVETLERNPAIAGALALARAAEQRASSVGALPDPVVGITAFLKSPETRTGPQVLTLNYLQSLPWLSKFDLEEQANLLNATALYSDVEAKRLTLATEVRRLYYELAFLVRHKEITQDFVDHLRQHEEISQARYATGAGASQDVIKIQAEITLAENLLLDIDLRRVDLEATLNDLRDLPASTTLLPALLPEGEQVALDVERLRESAIRSRPELTAADARIAASEARVKRAEKAFRPDFKIGLTYTFVDPRQDQAGMISPPEGNGDDIFGIQGGVSVPIWRKRTKAGVEEASQIELAAREGKRNVLAGIESAIGDLMQRIPLTWQQFRLLEDILILQAEESVQSAQYGYVSGTLNALDLLDAEHVLFRAETSIARAQADYSIRLVQLEGVVAEPLQQISMTEQSKP